MKFLKTIFVAAAATSMTLGVTSCSTDDDNSTYMLLSFSNDRIVMNPKTNAWNDVYNPECNDDLVYGGFEFSHYGTDQGYNYYYGFCPTLSTDNVDHQGDSEYQWSAITGSGLIPKVPYMIAYWSGYDESNGVKTCEIKCKHLIKNVAFFVTNSSYTYYSMKNGDSFTPRFEADDYLTLHVYASRNGQNVGHLDVPLATGTNLVDSWIPVDLSSMGVIDCIWFTMSSSASNEYGMTIPSYFCLDAITFELAE